MRVAVIGDVHANAVALQGALKIADEGVYDQLIFLGDLLTYGADVVETLELIRDRLATGNTVLLRGNHDALYRDLLKGISTYYNQLPVWIKESVMWTLDQLPFDIWSQLSFKEEYKIQEFLFSHANPFGPEKWGYLNTKAEHACAAEALLERGLRVGVFGHTHRTKWYRYSSEFGGFESNLCGELDFHAVHVLNAGSIGQPRDRANTASYVLWLTIGSDCATPSSFELQKFNWDVARYMKRVAVSGQSAETLTRISAFFDHTS